jgi:hypothetical protein
MKIKLCRSPFGLSGAYDDDREAIKRLKHDEIYEVDIKLQRNPAFHRKYFALFRVAWEYQNEDTQSWFGSMDAWRKAVEVAAGHCEKAYSLTLNDWVEIPKSIAFDKMKEEEFQDLYERVKHVLFTIFLPDIAEEDFFEALKDF